MAAGTSIGCAQRKVGESAPALLRPWVLPPIDGELAGSFSLPDSPAIEWRIQVQTSASQERRVSISADGRGFRLRGGAVLDAHGDGRWFLTDVEVDAAEWFGPIAARELPDVRGVDCRGRIAMQGEGTRINGVWDGRLESVLRDGRWEDPARKLLIEGIAGRLAIESLHARRTRGGQEFTWTGGRFDLVTFGAGRMELALDGDEVRVDTARVSLFGGELQASSVVWSKAKARLSAVAHLQGVEIQQLLFLLPPVLSAAKGRLDGNLALEQGSAGVQIGIGRLQLRQGEVAELRLAPSPGLLSARLPAQVRAHYPGLEQLETGGVPLVADVVEVMLNPAGDAEGRTAVVRIEGGPVDPSLKAPVVLQVNVRGPLDSLVKFGTSKQLGFGGAR